MFDTLRSSYPLGEHLTDKDLQTKDLFCSMDHYYIDPAGQLFSINYSGVSDWEPDNDSTKFWPYKLVPNGNHGKVTPVLLTRDVRLYGSGDNAWYETTVTFLKGKVLEVKPEEYYTFNSLNLPTFQ